MTQETFTPDFSFNEIDRPANVRFFGGGRHQPSQTEVRNVIADFLGDDGSDSAKIILLNSIFALGERIAQAAAMIDSAETKAEYEEAQTIVREIFHLINDAPLVNPYREGRNAFEEKYIKTLWKVIHLYMGKVDYRGVRGELNDFRNCEWRAFNRLMKKGIRGLEEQIV